MTIIIGKPRKLPRVVGMATLYERHELLWGWIVVLIYVETRRV